MMAPERHRTLAEVCELYFPGITPCALRWMIKRRGYAHSRWGREYRLTDSQVAAIQQDMAQAARPVPSVSPGPRGAGARRQAGSIQNAGEGGKPPDRRHRQPLPRADVKQALAEQLSSPLAVAAQQPPAPGRGKA